MKKNIGMVDMVLRILFGLSILVYGLLNESYFGLIGLIPLFTGLVRWCPLYYPFKIDTNCNRSCNSKED
jgi:hypothetical protein